MRRALLVVVSLLAVAVVVLLALPFLLKDRLVALFLDEVSTRVDADVRLGAADVTLLPSFPDLTLQVEDLAVVGRGAFAGVELARVGSLAITADLASVLRGGTIRVTGLNIASANVHVIVDEEGRSNTDLGGGGAAPAEEEGSEPSSQLWLRGVSVADLGVTYEDRPANRRVVVEDLDLAGDAEVGGELVAMRADLGVASLTVFDGTSLVDGAKVRAGLDVRWTPVTGAVQLGESTLELNALALALSGKVTPAATGTDLDLVFSTSETTLKGLLSLVPGAYTPDFGGVRADGTLAIRGAVKGLLPKEGESLPGFDVSVAIGGGSFQYPDLPAAVTGIDLDLALHHPGGPPDALVVDVPRFRLAVDGAPLEGRLTLRTPVSDPAIDTQVAGRLDLGRLSAAFPDSVRNWTGRLDVDLDLAGKVSAFSSGDVDRVRAAGTFALTDATWTDPDQPLPITVEQLSLRVDPKAVDLTTFRLRFGASDLAASGRVENAIAWALSDGVLLGRLDARSSNLDLNPWSGGGEEGASEGAKGDEPEESSLFVVPKDLDLTVGVDFARVRYEEWDLRQVRGRARVRDGTVTLDDLRAGALGGQIAISGTYSAPTEAEADVDLHVRATDLAAAETFTRVETIRRLLPGIEDVAGRVRSGFGVRARLGKDLSPDLASLASDGTFGSTGLTLRSEFLGPVAAFLGDDRYGKLALDGGDVGFRVDGGKLRIDKLPIRLGPAKGAIQGRTGVLDESLDLTLDLAVPASAIKSGEAAKALLGKKLDTVDVKALIGGTWKAPKVRVGLGDSLQGAVDAAVAEAREAVEEKVGEVVDTLVAEAKARGDALVREAEAQADKLRVEAKKQIAALEAEADKKAAALVKQAKGNPLQEAAAKEVAKALRKEADKQAAKLSRETDEQADKLVATAKKERDRLVAEAEKKVKR